MMKHYIKAIYVALSIVAAASGASLHATDVATEGTEHNAATEHSNTPTSKISGEWVITRIGDTQIYQEDEMPYLNFDTQSKRFYASNGCNIINGAFSIDNNTLRFSSVLSTMKACPHNTYQQKISKVLSNGNAVRFKATDDNSFTTLTLTDLRGVNVMTLSRHRLSFIDGMWCVTAINGKPINNGENDDETEANIFFDTAAHRLHGNTGCNFFNGEIYIDPALPNNISFTGMGVTRMACPKSSQETEMLVALEETVSCIKTSANTLELIDSAGHRVLTLKKM